jgi:hypothetical protein
MSCAGLFTRVQVRGTKRHEATFADTGRQAAYAGRSRDRRGMEPSGAAFATVTVRGSHSEWLCGWLLTTAQTAGDGQAALS